MAGHKVEAVEQKLQILVPLAGGSMFFDQEEFYFPKPLVEIGGKSMIEYTLSSLKRNVKNVQFIFLVRKEDVIKFSLESILKLRAGADSIVIPVDSATRGALCTCLLAIDAIDPTAPLLISNGDQVVDADISKLMERVDDMRAAAGVFTFSSVHPRWSYARVDEDGLITQAAEKSVISEYAIAGMYYFKEAQTFFDAAMDTILANDQFADQFFIAPSLNQVILKDKRVVTYKIVASAFHSFYSPAKFQEYADKQAVVSDRPKTVVVIPAAGDGSRFAKAGWKRPKPFIDLDGKSMIEHVLTNVRPKDSKVVTLLRSDHVSASPDVVERIAKMSDIVHVHKLTEGTLCTVMLARKHFNDDDAVLVANSDQLIDFSVEDFVDDCFRRDLDGSILVFRDVDRDPKWSFAKVDGSGLVTEVAEKKAISDLATVGVYFFRKASEFIKASIDMIVHNDRVNQEFYTCPVYNYLIQNGARIGVYEVPHEAMHGLGIPEDLRSFVALRKYEKSVDEPDA